MSEPEILKNDAELGSQETESQETAVPQAPAETPDEESEWDRAVQKAFPNYKGEGDQENDGNPPDDAPAQTPEPPAPEAAKEEPAAQTPAPDAGLEYRMSQHQAAQEYQAVYEDVKGIVFKDFPSEIKDVDGDPIRSVEDVMKRVKPDGEPFTEEEAAVWFMQAKQNHREQREALESRARSVAQVNSRLKDEASSVLAKFGDLLKNDPDLGARVSAQYEKTLVRGEEGIILEAPVSLAEFYGLALSPHQEAAALKSEAEAAKARVTEIEKLQEQSARSDIYSPSSKPAVDKEEAEWQRAVENYYGKQA